MVVAKWTFAVWFHADIIINITLGQLDKSTYTEAAITFFVIFILICWFMLNLDFLRKEKHF